MQYRQEIPYSTAVRLCPLHTSNVSTICRQRYATEGRSWHSDALCVLCDTMCMAFWAQVQVTEYKERSSGKGKDYIQVAAGPPCSALSRHVCVCVPAGCPDRMIPCFLCHIIVGV